MGLSEFVNSIVERFKPQRSSALDTLVAPGISADYHSGFISECRNGVQDIQEIKEWLLSRKLRERIDELCEAANKVIGSCQDDPARVSDVRELPSILRRIPLSLQEHTTLQVSGGAHDLKFLNETTQTIDALKAGFEQMSQDILIGSRINLRALNETLTRMAEKRTGSVPNFEGLH